jgi:hypothetical protein
MSLGRHGRINFFIIILIADLLNPYSFILMALEALAAIGLVSSIVQFVDFASELLSKTNELRQSTNGADAENANLETTSQVLRRLSEGLCTTFDAIT